eukprot:6498774-Pyramimonas_sp.AAC.1
MNPSAQAMQALLRPHSRSAVGACAGDVGATLQQRSLLKGMWHALRSADSLGGLRLKYHKCVLIPLEGILSGAGERPPTMASAQHSHMGVNEYCRSW